MCVTDNKCSLNNRSVLITRPLEQNQKLAEKIRALGASPIEFPCIEIIATDLDAAMKKLPFDICTTDIVIFVSINAVQYGMLETSEFSKQLSTSVQFAAIGAATRERLAKVTAAKIISPGQPFDSAALLQLPEFQRLEDKHIIIVKGIGGRQELYEHLTQRGARLANLDVYQRCVPKRINRSVLAQTIDASLFSSSESVDNILTIMPESFRPALLNSQVITGHPRIAAKVTSLGFKKLPIIAASPTDAAMLAALINWANTTEIKDER
jgi:uroporphyrinogen-III synthase